MLHPEGQLSKEFVGDWVSVVIPTYNRETMLAEALESVRQQTYRPIEIIVVDDGSTDSTRDMVEAFSREHLSADFKGRYFYQSNKNASACRNFGLLKSVGEYIQFLDSDDLLHPDKLESQVAKLRESKLDFVWSSTIMFKQQVDWSASIYVGSPNEVASKIGLNFRLY